ncbi:MAG: AMP-binding protein [Pirellulaceae bacterium]|nr:AMP-binding protein [Pirellulaceae bacterium]
MEVTTLVQLLRRRAERLQEKPAFRFVRAQDGDVVCLTYAQLHCKAMAVAAHLQTRMQRGERAWLLFPPGLDSIVAFFGCLYAGVVAVPLSPPRGRRLASLLEPAFAASEPSIVLTTSEHQEQAASLYAEFPALLNLPWIAVDRIEDEPGQSWRDPGVEAGDLAFLQYTSGSTAAPKGVMLSHGNLLHNSALIHEVFETDEDCVAVFWLPLYHDMGLIGGVIQPIYCGGSCTLLAPAAFLQRPLSWLETITEQRASISGGPDFAYDVCARKIGEAERAGLDLSSWRVAFTGAEPIRAGTLERFADSFSGCGFRRESFLPVYGLAEATLMATGGPRGNPPTTMDVDSAALSEGRICGAGGADVPTRRLVGSGAGLTGQRVAIVDPATCQLCSADRVGEIWIGGPSVALGYFRQPQATETTFHNYLTDTGEGPFLRTGDLGFIHRGQVFVTGRLKDRIIIRGRNHYPQDIELTVEAACPGFRAGHGVAFSVEVEDQEKLVVVQELEPRTRSLDWDAAFQSIRQAVSTAHDLEVYSIVLTKAGTVPTTTSGKRQRSACRQLFLDDDLESLARWTAPKRNGHPHPLVTEIQAPVVPRTTKDIENWLVQRIAQQLGVPTSQVSVHTPFLDMGMGSMDAMEVAADLQTWLDRQLSPTAIYNYPSIVLLAHWLANPVATPSPPPVGAPLPLPADFDPQQTLLEIQQLTEEEMAAMLLEELAREQSAR